MEKDEILSVLADIKSRRPCWKSRFIELKLKKLKGPDAGIAKRLTISIDQEIADKANLETMRYLLGHEYGHIYHNHSLYIYIYSIPALLVFCLWPSPLNAILLLFLFCIVLWLFSDFSDYMADDLVKDIYGASTAINGLLWVGKQTNTLNNPQRIKRLKRMGWENDSPNA